MIERMDDAPAGVIGIRASGKLTKEEYARVLEPGAWIEDVKTGLKVETQNRSAWKKLAFVTGVDWVARAMKLFAWAMPGELAVYEMDQLDEAKSWVAS